MSRPNSFSSGIEVGGLTPFPFTAEGTVFLALQGLSQKMESTMTKMDPKLEKLCRDNPQERQNVLITLSEEAKDLKAADLGLAEGRMIGSLGIIKGSFVGKKLLELSKRSEIEEITPDIEVRALSRR
jgi:hypothetical protein